MSRVVEDPEWASRAVRAINELKNAPFRIPDPPCPAGEHMLPDGYGPQGCIKCWAVVYVNPPGYDDAPPVSASSSRPLVPVEDNDEQ